MLRSLQVAAMLALMATIAPAAAQPPAFTPRDESPADYPAGEGRDKTFYTCTACHGFKLVAQQGQSRRQWDDTLDFMTERHKMPKLENPDRDIILTYLAAQFPPRQAPGRQNPFSPR
jgi:mono/diheme cytochrome c family protein